MYAFVPEYNAFEHLCIYIAVTSTAVTPGVTHVGAYHRPSDGHFRKYFMLQPVLITSHKRLGKLLQLWENWANLTKTGRFGFRTTCLDWRNEPCFNQ